VTRAQSHPSSPRAFTAFTDTTVPAGAFASRAEGALVVTTVRTWSRAACQRRKSRVAAERCSALSSAARNAGRHGATGGGVTARRPGGQ
jgi:hypothetical protein